MEKVATLFLQTRRDITAGIEDKRRTLGRHSRNQRSRGTTEALARHGRNQRFRGTTENTKTTEKKEKTRDRISSNAPDSTNSFSVVFVFSVVLLLSLGEIGVRR